MGPGVHSVSNLSGDGLFNGADVRDLYNLSTVPVDAPEKG